MSPPIQHGVGTWIRLVVHRSVRRPPRPARQSFRGAFETYRAPTRDRAATLRGLAKQPHSVEDPHSGSAESCDDVA
jgi:hypothetical protein